MHAKSENANPLEPNAHNILPSSIGSQPWWRGAGYNGPPPVLVGERASKSLEPQDGSIGTKSSQSQGVDGLDEGTGVTKEMRTNITPQSDGNYGHEHQHLQHVASTIPPAGGEYLVPHAQLELVGHSVACASYPYSDPYYGGIMAAYGPQALVHPHLFGMHHPRMPLPLEMTEEPVYVNAKQYHGILRRRQSRAKAELEKKLIKVRKPYLHESRHQHAMRRARGCGGRFLNTKKLQKDATNPKPDKGMGTHSASSTCSEPSPSDCTRNLDSSCQHRDTYSNGNSNSNGSYQRQGFQLSTFHPLSGERGEEGDCSGQQRGSISVSQASHRALTIQ